MGLSAARQTPASRSRTTRAPQILEIIFTGHCTPVQRVQQGGLLAPPRFHAHMQVEIDSHSEYPLHLLTRQRADLLEHGAPGPDDNSLLAIALHPDGGVDPRDSGRLFPLVD